MEFDAVSADETAAWLALVDATVAAGPLDLPGSPAPCDLQAAPSVGLIRDLAEQDPASLPPPEAIAYLRATERVIAWVQGLQARALVSMAGPRVHVDQVETSSGAVTIEDASRSEVAAAARWSESWAHDRITAARLLHGPLRSTGAALLAGEISLRHVDAICTAARRLSSCADWLTGTDGRSEDFGDACASLEAAALPVARAREVAATRRSADRTLARIDADHAERRRRRARRQRDVWIEHEEDGLALLIARMDAARAHACLTVVDALAHGPTDRPSHEPADRLVGERRADALVGLLLREASGCDVASGEDTVAPRVHVEVVVDLPTLLGLAEVPGTLRGGGPGGPEPVSASAIRELVLADPTSTMRRLVTDPLTGHLLDRGRSTYTVPDALRAFVAARDITCRFPGCHRRAQRGQADHARPWRQGGETSRANLGMLCIRHHQLKTHAGWSIVSSSDDGSCLWRSPAGEDYDHPPPPVLSDG